MKSFTLLKMQQALILITGALLLSQFVHALPHTKREVETLLTHNSIHSSHESSAEEDNPKMQLMAFTIGQLSQLSKWILEKGSIVVKNTVEELNEIPQKDALLQANITRMHRIATETSQLNLEDNKEGIIKRFEFLIDFATMMEDYENMPADSKLRHTLKTALENNGYNRFESEFEEKIIELAKNFDQAFAEYVKALTLAEKAKDAKLLEWYQAFKAETDREKKLDKFSDLFSF
ncbi:uncharacterized protein LOC118738475 [Rhagoletis pomonella]|uniref:uncharacterized protein LOC118738475 n=1 Tax=Rhagoletis pomonella TaxID=28610 RepID=UPI001781BE70|nr:uncharacterized protein LOC118738475 [Rhagoletis pomonella]